MSTGPLSTSTDQPRRVPASLLAVAAIFSVQFGNALVGSLFDRVGPLGAAALRLGLAALILLIVVRPRVRDWGARTWLGVVLLGLGMGGMNVFIYLAIDRIPIGIAVTIELMGPLAVAAAGIRRLVDAGWVLLAIGGILLLGLDGGGAVNLVGAACAAVAAAFWALYILASARLGARVRGVDGLVAAMVVAALVVVPVGAADAAVAVRQSPSLLLAFVGVALLTSAIPYALEFLALKRMSTRMFGVLSSLGPAVAALAGFVVLHQRLDLGQMLAVLLVVCASAGVVATSRRGA
ncbi:MAG: DMT family transporter [Leucobacter sp.]